MCVRECLKRKLLWYAIWTKVLTVQRIKALLDIFWLVDNENIQLPCFHQPLNLLPSVGPKFKFLANTWFETIHCLFLTEGPNHQNTTFHKWICKKGNTSKGVVQQSIIAKKIFWQSRVQRHLVAAPSCCRGHATLFDVSRSIFERTKQLISHCRRRATNANSVSFLSRPFALNFSEQVSNLLPCLPPSSNIFKEAATSLEQKEKSHCCCKYGASISVSVALTFLNDDAFK